MFLFRLIFKVLQVCVNLLEGAELALDHGKCWKCATQPTRELSNKILLELPKVETFLESLLSITAKDVLARSDVLQFLIIQSAESGSAILGSLVHQSTTIIVMGFEFCPHSEPFSVLAHNPKDTIMP
jgi:hypothetical protein